MALHRDKMTPAARCIWNKQYLFVIPFVIFFLDAINVVTKKQSCQKKEMRYTLAQKRLITRSQESNRNNNKCRINQKYYSDFLQILFHKRIPPLCPIRFLLSLWYTWFCYRTINRFITNRSCKTKKAFIQGFICLMGRLMGFEPTSDGATIRCVNHFTIFAILNWQGQQESNPHWRFWRPVYYRCTMPLLTCFIIIANFFKKGKYLTNKKKIAFFE